MSGRTSHLDDRAVRAGALAVVVVLVTLATRPSGDPLFIDHAAAARTHALMRDGAGFYAAWSEAFESLGVRMSEARSFRQPWLQLSWLPWPPRAIEATFLVLVVGGTAQVGSILARRWWCGAFAAAWVVGAGYHAGSRQWLISELWAVPAILAAILCRLGGRHRQAAAWALLAGAIRETSVLLLLGLALAPGIERRRRWPYAAALVVWAALYLGHLVVASRYAAAVGNEAPSVGTGGLDRVWDMTSYGGRLVPDTVGVAVWLASVHRTMRTRLFWLLPLLMLPLSGLVIGRDYWGLVSMPAAALAAVGLIDEAPTRPSADRV